MSVTDQIAAIEARLTADEAEYGTGYEWEHSFLDRRALLALVREQRAALERVEALVDAYPGGWPYTILERDIRAAITDHLGEQ